MVLHCGMAVDATYNQGFKMTGSSSMTATDLYLVASGYQKSSSASLTVTNGINESQPPVMDPYAGVSSAIPSSIATCTQTGNYHSPGGTLPTGLYCGGLTFDPNTTTTLNGTYYVCGGNVVINNNATVNTQSGGGSTIIMTANSSFPSCSSYPTLTINGGANVSLVAPTSGTFSGLVFFQDRNAPLNNDSKVNGGSNQYITGAIYLPRATITFNGNSTTTGAGKCTQIIGYDLTFTGNSSIQLQCDGTGIVAISRKSSTIVQ